MTTWETLAQAYDNLNSNHDCKLSPNDGCDACELVANFYDAKRKAETELSFWENNLLKIKYEK